MDTVINMVNFYVTLHNAIDFIQKRALYNSPVAFTTHIQQILRLCMI